MEPKSKQQSRKTENEDHTNEPNKPSEGRRTEPKPESKESRTQHNHDIERKGVEEV